MPKDRRERTKTRMENPISAANLDAVYNEWCRSENKGEHILTMTVEKLKELGVQEIEISPSLMKEYEEILAKIVREPMLVKRNSEALSVSPLEGVSLENAKAYKMAKDILLKGHKNIQNLTDESKMLEFIKGESMALSRDIYRCFLNERIVEEAETGTVALSDKKSILQRTINLLGKIIKDEYDDDFVPIDIFPFNLIGLEIKKDAIKAVGKEIAGITVDIIKGLARLIQDYLIGYIKSTTPIKKMYAFYGFLNKLANSDGLEMLLSLVIRACAPYFSLKPVATGPTHGLLLYRGLIIFLLQLANSTPGGAEDVKEDGLNRGYEMFQAILTKQPTPLYRSIMADENCNIAWNAWLTNVTYAIFRNNSKGSGVFLQSDVPLLERNVRGRGADLRGERTSGAMTRDVEMSSEPEPEMVAPPAIAQKKKKSKRKRKSSKKKKGKKKKQTKRRKKK